MVFQSYYSLIFNKDSEITTDNLTLAFQSYYSLIFNIVLLMNCNNICLFQSYYSLIFNDSNI